MKKLLILIGICSPVWLQAQVSKLTVTPTIGARYTSWTTTLPVPPTPYGTAPITEEKGILPELGVSIQYQFAKHYWLRAKGEGFTGNTRLNGEYVTDYGIDMTKVVQARNQKIKWTGGTAELFIGGNFLLGEQLDIRPELGVLYSGWKMNRPVVEDPYIVMYDSKFRWTRASAGIELGWNLNDNQRIYIRPALRMPLSTRESVQNFRSSDNFEKLIEQYMQKVSNAPNPREAAIRLIEVSWPNTGLWDNRKIKALTGYSIEAGWQSHSTLLAIQVENLAIEELSWRPSPQVKSMYIGFRVGVPIRIQKKTPKEPGYFMPSSTR